MTLLDDKSISREVSIPESRKRSIKMFLQGAVYSWCKNRKGEWFSLQDLMGGDNFYWEGTPLEYLYQRHEKLGKTPPSALKDAGIDAGWLLKGVLKQDLRKFRTHAGYRKKYKWDTEQSQCI